MMTSELSGRPVRIDPEAVRRYGASRLSHHGNAKSEFSAIATESTLTTTQLEGRRSAPLWLVESLAVLLRCEASELIQAEKAETPKEVPVTETPAPSAPTEDHRKKLMHCDHCGKECHGGQGKAAHERKCPENPANKPVPDGAIAPEDFNADEPVAERGCPECDLPCSVDPCDHTDCTRDDDTFEVRSCRVCGCTDEEACEDGCYWVEDPEGLGDLCSTCLPQVLDVPCDAPCDRVKDRIEDYAPKRPTITVDVTGLKSFAARIEARERTIEVLCERIIALEAQRGVISHYRNPAPYTFTDADPIETVRAFAESVVAARRRARFMEAAEALYDELYAEKEAS